MPSFQVLTDSNAHIPPALCQELQIRVVPLPYLWEGTTYNDGVDFAPRDFYRRFRSSQNLPKTSGPTPGVFLEAFRELAANGKPILAILVGADYSSTQASAELAARELLNAKITIFNSCSNALGLGFQVLAAARAARDGADLEQALAVVRRVQANSGVVFAVPDLNYLRQGGRIGLAQSLLSNALRLVPILELDQGPIRPVERVRTQGRAISRLVELTKARVGDERPRRIGVLHADAENRAWQLKNLIEREMQPDELLLVELNPILAIHVGPGAFGIGYASGD
ncbi:MAG: DegV family protein [Anaerolineales bacterium]